MTTAASLVDYTVEVNEGEVILDIIHRLQATQAGDLGGALELQGRKRVVQRRGQRQAAAHVHDPDVAVAEDETVTVTPSAGSR